MTLLLNPILDALNIARTAADELIHPGDEVSVEDSGGQLIFTFVPQGEGLGGGVRVSINKTNSKVIEIVREQ